MGLSGFAVSPHTTKPEKLCVDNADIMRYNAR